jgi:hypothetical protein
MGIGKKLSPSGEIEFAYEDDDGEEVSVLLPGKHEVCDECGGHGRHTNRAIDGNGITASEWADWDDDEREAYMTGKYDVTCTVCGGEKVVAVVDVQALEAQSPELLEKFNDFVEAEAANNRERRYCERYGC